MYSYNSIVQLKNYGKIVLKVSEIMDQKNISRNKLSCLTGVKYSVIDRYYRADNVERVDLDILSRICYVLNCNLNELMEYRTD